MSNIAIYPIVGSFYRPPAKAILDSLPINTPLVLRPEPNNAVDHNAIAVWVKTEDIPESCYNTIGLNGAGCGFKINREAPAESFEAFLDEIRNTPEWHLGYIPAIIAKTMSLSGDASAKLVVNLAGKLSAQRISERNLDVEED